MGRPPTHGAPSFRFFPNEVAQMETLLREQGGHVPAREVLVALADKFSASPERSGKITVQMKQVWNWFQNRRYALRSKLVKAPGNMNMPPNSQGEATPVRNAPPVPQQTFLPPGHNVAKNTSENPPMEFEAKSARDGAWYDVQAFHSHRYLETGNPEVLVRFSGFGPEEDEWINVRKHVRQRSLPCESTECVAVLPGDLILCFQEGKEQALYFDAHVLDAQRRRHDVRGCRCRFLVRYDHDQSEEIVPLRKVCRRPETDYRLQVLHAANEPAESKHPVVDPNSSSTLRVTNPNLSAYSAASAPTMMNAGVGAPHPAPTATLNPTVAPASAVGLVPAFASTSVPASAPAKAPALASSSVPAPTPTPAPASASNLVSAATPAPALTSTSVPTPIPAPTLASTSVPALSPAAAFESSSPTLPSTSIPALVSALPALVSAPPAAVVSTPLPALVSTPAPAVVSIPIPALVSAPASTPALASAPVLAPTSSPISISAPTSSPIHSSAPMPPPSLPVTPISVPDPTPALATAPAPDAALVSSATPALFSIPEAVPELQKIEGDIPGTSSEVSAQKNTINPGAANEVVEVKMEESSIPESVTLAGTSVSQVEMSNNPSVLVPKPEGVEGSAPGEPSVAVSPATTDGDTTVLAKAEISDVAVSAEEAKE